MAQIMKKDANKSMLQPKTKMILYIHPNIFLSFALYKNVWRLAFKYV